MLAHAYRTKGVIGYVGRDANRVRSGIRVGGGNRDGNGVGVGVENGNVNVDGEVDGAETRTGVDTNKETQDGNEHGRRRTG